MPSVRHNKMERKRVRFQDPWMAHHGHPIQPSSPEAPTG